MVFCVKMSEITGTPSDGQPFPLKGSQNGEEYGRVPTKVMGVPPVAPVMVQAAGALAIGQGMFGPPAVVGEAYGKWNVIPAGRGNASGLSARKGPQATVGSPIAADTVCRSRHVLGFPGLRSCDANSRCPWRPTYAIVSTRSFATSL